VRAKTVCHEFMSADDNLAVTSKARPFARTGMKIRQGDRNNVQRVKRKKKN